jgi:hypothetical protein
MAAYQPRTSCGLIEIVIMAGTTPAMMGMDVIQKPDR